MIHRIRSSPRTGRGSTRRLHFYHSKDGIGIQRHTGDDVGMPDCRKTAQCSAALTIASIVKTKYSEPLAACTVLGQASRRMVLPAPRSSSPVINAVSSARLPYAAQDRPRLRREARSLIRRRSRRKRKSWATRTVPMFQVGSRLCCVAAPEIPGLPDIHLLERPGLPEASRHPSSGFQTSIFSSVRASRHPSSRASGGFQTSIFSSVRGFQERSDIRFPGSPDGASRHPSSPFSRRDGKLQRTVARAAFFRRILDTAGRFGTFVHYWHCGHKIGSECPPLYQESR